MKSKNLTSNENAYASLFESSFDTIDPLDLEDLEYPLSDDIDITTGSSTSESPVATSKSKYVTSTVTSSDDSIVIVSEYGSNSTKTPINITKKDFTRNTIESKEKLSKNILIQDSANKLDSKDHKKLYDIKVTNNSTSSIKKKKGEKSLTSIPSFVSEVSKTEIPLRQDEDEYFKFQNIKIWNYFKREMFGIGEPGHLESASVQNIQNFLRVPFKLERFLIFGVIICLDAFLFVLTFLPVRVIYSFSLLGIEIIVYLISFIIRSDKNSKNKSKRWYSTNKYFHRSNLYDLLRGFLLLVGCASLQLLDMSRVYHFIRGQSMIKLYVLTAIMEMFDKLMATFGQDIFGSLYWQIRTHSNESLFLTLIVACIYISIHSTIYFVNIATLAVAINSSDRALVTVLILNNVSEIKMFVFKKFDATTLFQLSCGDITERFHLMLFLICITVGGVAQSGDLYLEALKSHGLIMGMFLCAELISDFIKHAFITKFNEIDASIYDDFRKVLRNDILNSHKDKVILDQSFAITRRVGLSQLPLGCVCIRYFMLAFVSSNWVEVIQSLELYKKLLIALVLFVLLNAIKIFIGLGIVVYAGNEHNKELQKLNERRKDIDSDACNVIDDNLQDYEENSLDLSSVDRFTTIEGKIIG